jgi:hypothetical protein
MGVTRVSRRVNASGSNPFDRSPLEEEQRGVVGGRQSVRRYWLLFDSPLAPGPGCLVRSSRIVESWGMRPRLEQNPAFRVGDEARVAAVRDRAKLLGKLYEVGTMPGRIVVGIKAALAAMGICRDGVASSFEQFDAGQRQDVAAILEALGTSAC